MTSFKVTSGPFAGDSDDYVYAGDQATPYSVFAYRGKVYCMVLVKDENYTVTKTYVHSDIWRQADHTLPVHIRQACEAWHNSPIHHIMPMYYYLDKVFGA